MTQPDTRRRSHPVFAWVYAHLSAATESGPVGRLRADLVQEARGVTVDLGAGTGANLPHLPDAVTEVHLVEPDRHMRARLAARTDVGPVERRVVHDAAGEQMPFADASVDTVVTTLTLCSVDDPGAVAAEVRRVLRPGGRLLVLEHVASPDGRIARRQRRLTPLWRRAAGGCHLDRDTGATLRAAGFDTALLRPVEVPAPAVTRRLLVGTIVRS